jgi:hypothetical protein
MTDVELEADPRSSHGVKTDAEASSDPAETIG